MEDLLESACPPAPGHPAGAADAAGTAGPRAAVRRNVAAVALGNAVEFFDFGAYATFAVMIGHTFFPAKSPFVSLLLSVSVFGLGFVVRPLGALVIGAYADRAGRKPAMMLTLVMMAVGTGAIAVLPGYETIGVAAPILLVVTRLIQGLAWGGEAGPATTYILEAAPPSGAARTRAGRSRRRVSRGSRRGSRATRSRLHCPKPTCTRGAGACRSRSA
ncbi:sugar transporter family protein [Burkholderia thailandensis]|uniref:Sugar transporter family protein n=1 Tax=Burkholderia thailandensis TaxID=57975 RepID=A0AAW9D3J5_BURTH|nr:sugar transporter family protein [Burkholderia thailandensis]